MRWSTLFTAAVLALISATGAGYLAFGVLDWRPAGTVTHITVLLTNSGGLMPTSQATMRGIKVGRVAAIRATAAGLAVAVDVDPAYAIPAQSRVSVENLSAAGEQYLEFAPDRLTAPYLNDGAVVPTSQVEPSFTVSDLLSKGSALMDALDPASLHTIVTSVAEGVTGNTATLDQLATATELFAGMVRDRFTTLNTLVHNMSTITDRLGQAQAGQRLKEAAELVPGALQQLGALVVQLERLRETTHGAFGDDEQIAGVLDKIFEYMDELAEPMTTFSTVLAPITAPMRGVKIDAGHWLDFWDSTFSDQGGMRVHLSVPAWSSAQPNNSPHSERPSR